MAQEVREELPLAEETSDEDACSEPPFPTLVDGPPAKKSFLQNALNNPSDFKCQADGNYHLVCSVKTFANFAPFFCAPDLPVPWHWLLDYNLRRMMQRFYCTSCLYVGQLNGHMSQALLPVHADSGEESLEFRASLVVLKSALQQFVNGSGFNAKYMWYREVANNDVTDSLRYVGSVWIMGLHVIYIKMDSLSLYNLFSCLNFGDDKYVVRCPANCYIVMRCRNCKKLSEAVVMNCAKVVNCFLRKLTAFAVKRRMVMRKGRELREARQVYRQIRYGDDIKPFGLFDTVV